jgi:hypothetical protein
MATDLPNPPDVSTSTSQDLRCPRCDAHVRAGADWCTLCYQDLRPAPEVPEPAEPVAAYPVDEVEAAGPADADVPDDTAAPAPSGRHARPAAERPPGLPDAQIARMLERLAAEESDVPLGALSGRVTSPGVKAGLIIGGSIVATVLVYVVMTLVGTLL